MKFRLYRVTSKISPPDDNAIWDSDIEGWTIELSSLQELIDLGKNHECLVIIGTHNTGNLDEYTYVTIYDEYTE